MTRSTLCAAVAAVAAVGLASQAQAQINVNNGIAPGTFGHLEYEINAAGDVYDGFITGRRFDGELETTSFIYEYLHYIDVGSDGEATRLSLDATSGPTLTAPNEVSSAGRFTGSNGNGIEFTTRSFMLDGDSRLYTELSFQAVSGSLGLLDLISYVDQDVLGTDDDVLFTTGSAAAGSLQVFTVDDAEIIGVSQSGSYNAAQGLEGASFLGFTADQYSDLRDDIEGATVLFSPTGVIDLTDLPLVPRPALPGDMAYGPNDVTSALAWRVDPQATTATIYTVLGGVPDTDSIPEPASLAMLGLSGLLLRRRR